MGTLVEICPEVVLGRYLAVTSIDSGDAWLTDKQRLAGWQLRSGIAYSPLLTTRGDLIYQTDGLDVPGYDEWYLFETKGADLGEPIKENFFEPINAPRPGHLLVFVNQLAFTIDPTPDVQFFAEMFWRQLEWIRPESYVSDGQDQLTFLTRNDTFFDTVYERLSKALSE